MDRAVVLPLITRGKFDAKPPQLLVSASVSARPASSRPALGRLAAIRSGPYDDHYPASTAAHRTGKDRSRAGSTRKGSPLQSRRVFPIAAPSRSEEHTSELQSLAYLVCRLLLEKK